MSIHAYSCSAAGENQSVFVRGKRLSPQDSGNSVKGLWYACGNTHDLLRHGPIQYRPIHSCLFMHIRVAPQAKTSPCSSVAKDHPPKTACSAAP